MTNTTANRPSRLDLHPPRVPAATMKAAQIVPPLKQKDDSDGLDIE